MIDQLSDSEQLERRLVELAEAEWHTEAEWARQQAKILGISQNAFNKAIHQR